MKTQHMLMILSLSFAACAAGQTPPPTQPAATPAPPPAAPPKLSAADLEKLLMPIALYPDALIATMLPASVYPLEIVQAARFMADTNNMSKIDEQPWDPSVKEVARVPAALKKMNDDLQWTIQLGEAFLNQDKDVMDTIQSLRAKAQKAGTLRTTEQQIVVVTNMVVEKTVQQQVVVVTNTIVQIQPANPQVIYVPTYPPTVYYPPPTYVYDPYAPLVTFAAGVAVGAIIANNCDWHHGGCYYGGGHGDVDIDINRNTTINRGNRPTQQKWQPDQSRLRTSGSPGSAQTREARGWGGAGTQPTQRAAAGTGAARPSQLPAGGAGGARPAQQPTAGTQPARTPGAGQPSAAQRPASSGAGARPTSTFQQPAASRPAQSSSVSRPSAQPSGAFSGVNSGSSARSASNRGAASRGGGGGSRGGGGGRR